MSSPRKRNQRGFTLLEIMIVVAIIAILAAVVIPTWTKESRKSKFDPEIRAMFAEIALKEEQYKSEISTTAGYAALATCPATTSSSGVDLLVQACYATTWVAARITPTDTKIRCTYAVTVGAANPAGSSPAVPVSSTFTLPANSASYTSAWYYILATCDMDNAGGTNATFFTSSWDTSVQKMNYGS